MADKKINMMEKVPYTLEVLSDPNAPEQEFYSLNGKNYIITRGIEVMIPRALVEIIENQKKERIKAWKYAQKMALREPKF